LPNFSFVIPAYNCKCLLRNTLEALNDQPGYGRDDYEVIVIDDGSVDGTGEYIGGVNRNYDLNYIYLDRNGRSSRSRARNYGWRAAAGEIVVFIDADIIVKPVHLAELDRFYRYESNLVVLGNRLLLPQEEVDCHGLSAWYRFGNCPIRSLDTPYFIFNALSYNAAVIRAPGLLLATNNSAVPRRYLEAVAGFDENFIGWGCEDLDLGYRLQVETDIKFTVNSRLEAWHQYHPRHSGDLNELKKNYRYLERKYAKSRSRISVSREYAMWFVRKMPRDQYQKKFLASGGARRQKVVLKFDNANDLSRLKEAIVRLSARAGIDLAIYDRVENTNLDIWIQLLGARPSTPRYYPVSKIIKYSNVPVLAAPGTRL
jgi:glycosyltransferase involved in cell wall biosynthesis